MQLAINLATVLAAVVFLIIGGMKLFSTKAYMADAGWVKMHEPSVVGVRTIGLLEILGALGLALPPVIDIGQPVIPIIAAIMLGLMQMMALVMHTRSRDFSGASISAAYILLPAFLVVVYSTLNPATVNWV